MQQHKTQRMRGQCGDQPSLMRRHESTYLPPEADEHIPDLIQPLAMVDQHLAMLIRTLLDMVQPADMAGQHVFMGIHSTLDLYTHKQQQPCPQSARWVGAP